MWVNTARERARERAGLTSPLSLPPFTLSLIHSSSSSSHPIPPSTTPNSRLFLPIHPLLIFEILTRFFFFPFLSHPFPSTQHVAFDSPIYHLHLTTPSPIIFNPLLKQHYYNKVSFFYSLSILSNALFFWEIGHLCMFSFVFYFAPGEIPRKRTLARYLD
uniref:Uncharacterized protein n=1 Tax=Caenorhabditis tropicalis TaxID=1561998 RepID=A0A1I7TWT1_9PELO